MYNSGETSLGSIVGLWRYPIKSMMGEELNSTEVTERGLAGDRAFALVDNSTGKVASAKNPRKWAKLFDFRAAYAEPLTHGAPLPPVRITLPDGKTVRSDQSDIDNILSSQFDRDVHLDKRQSGETEVVETTFPNPWTPSLEEYWPDIEGLAYRETVTDEAMPEGTFFDLAIVHLLTTSTIDQLRALYPEGRFEVRRFRPNIVVAPVNGQKGFIENDWIGRTVAIGDEVRLSITGPCPRCVMTTLPQGDLPKDPDVLRTAAKHNDVNVGVYASVVRRGTVRRGDPVRIE